MEQKDEIDLDKLLADTTKYLIEGQELYEASILLLCKLRAYIHAYHYSKETLYLIVELLTDSRTIYELMFLDDTNVHNRIHNAFLAATPKDYVFRSLRCSLEYSDFDPNWRDSLLEVIEGKRALNQGMPIQEKPRYSWENLHFRSPVEITIAKSLDKYRVLFLPNCMARLGLPDNRVNREADFLVCYEGKWGILEINGDTFHTSAAKDHDRGRLFKLHSIRVFEPYEAKRCMNEPDKVVREFLEILNKNG